MTKVSQSEDAEVVQPEIFRLTTAKVFCRCPEYPDLDQVFSLQALDRTPDFPKLHALLDKCTHKINGEVRTMQFGYTQAVRQIDLMPAETSGTC